MSDDRSSGEPSESAGPGDGDGDGESGDGDGEPGDGDGEPGDGDGDGDGEPGDGDGDGEPDSTECNPSAFIHAPAPVEIDGLSAVPIDILELDAELSFDATLATAQAQGTLTFQLGESGGMPILDLRQTPELLLLDGQPLANESLARHDFGVGLQAGFLILEVALEPCSVHTLEFDYALATPQAPQAAGLSFAQSPARAYFDLFATDLNPGRYLEAWLPANMPWDRHPISLGVTLEQTEAAHALISNAAVDEVAPHDWQLEFPSTTTAMDPMLVLMPVDELDSHTGVHMAANGQAIPYAIHVDTQVATSAAVVATNVANYLDEFVLTLGDYVHPELTIYVYATTRSMEYAGATTSAVSALKHEIFHSWWARGLSPASYADGWIDEGWATFNTGRMAFATPPFNWRMAPWQLRDPHPFARETPDSAYHQGRLVFAGLGNLMGLETLQAAMAELYASAPLGSITTAQLEQHLYCASGEQEDVRQAFHRFVYGLQDDAEPVPDGYCD
ncbi:MAG TPA: hypothetical protein VM869_07790 [Enhygromyxa sp.]|nr:hypothetical protein [Enhygromyxa sp.]